MANGQARQGSLERLGIPTETPIPDGVLTTSTVSSVRFRVSRPEGYAYGDVESFINDYVVPTITWYENALHQRDLAVHKVGEEADVLDVNNQNLKRELENKEYNEAIGLGIASEDASTEIDKLQDQNDSLRKRLATVEAQLKAKAAEPEGETYTVDEVQSFILGETEDLQKQLKEAQAQLARVQAQASKVETRTEYVEAEPDPEHWVPRAEVDQLIADAVAEAMEKAGIETPIDPEEAFLQDITDEGGLENKAAATTYSKAYKELERYAHQLEVENAKLRGEDPSRLGDHASYNRYQVEELPEITEEDLRN